MELLTISEATSSISLYALRYLRDDVRGWEDWEIPPLVKSAMLKEIDEAIRELKGTK